MYQDENNIYFIQYYHTYWVFNEDGEKIRNPRATTKLLDFKNNITSAVNYYTLKLEQDINIRNNKDVYVLPFPSHTANTISDSLDKLCETLSKNLDITYKKNILARTKNISKLSNGGNRSIKTHLNSLELKDIESIKDKTILLVDDITTTGNSLLAGRQLLLSNGASEVLCFALAKTVHETYDDVIEALPDVDEDLPDVVEDLPDVVEDKYIPSYNLGNIRFSEDFEREIYQDGDFKPDGTMFIDYTCR